MVDARELLHRARRRLESDPALRALPTDLAWMHGALARIRGEPCQRPDRSALVRLVTAKYALCLVAAALPLALLASSPWWALAAPVAFYCAEAQFVFLLPMAASGSVRPWRDARKRTRAAGGTFQVVATVVPIALYMLGAGFFGVRPVQAWLTGCLAIVLWHESLEQLSPSAA